MRCIYCGFQNVLAATECVNCGKPIETRIASTGTLASLEKELGPILPAWIDEEQGGGVTDASAPVTFDELDFAAPPPLPVVTEKTITPPPGGLRVPREKVDIDALAQPSALRYVPDEEGLPRRKKKPETPVIPIQPTPAVSASEFKCPRCRKIKQTANSVVINEASGGTRRVCYDCAHELRQVHAAHVEPGNPGHALLGLVGGIVAGLICAVIFAGASFITHNVWLEIFFLAGFITGIGTRTGAENRHGLYVQIAAVLATVVAFGFCVYSSYVGLNNIRFLSLDELQNQLKTNPLQPLDWVSLGAAMVLAYFVPNKPGVREIK